MRNERLTTSTGRLVRHGFQDVEHSVAALDRLGDASDQLLHLIASTADPDQAVTYLADLADRVEDRQRLLDALVDDEGSCMRLLAVLGATTALGDHLLRHPEHWHDLTDPALGSTRPAAFAVRGDLLRAVGADPLAAVPVATGEDAGCVDALRVAYRRLLLRLAARDLSHGVGVDDVAAELSDLAAGTLDAALAIARARVGASADGARLGVIAMGKCGGHELNYVSDVDVIFVAEAAEGYDEPAALRAATQLASNLMRICSDHTGEGTIWPVDAALRPEGKSGPLVRTLASHEGYYQKWAKTWEFQALLKARPVAGDLPLGQEFCARVAPMVWSASERDGFVTDVQAMRRRVVEHIPAAHAERQIKLGSGGLRDVEFAVQLLQLVHGRADESVRAPTTLSALAHLTHGGYVGREDGAALDGAYRFLRTLEHRMQLWQLRRTHVLPEDHDALRRLGRSMGFMREPVEELNVEWRRHSREVRRLHEKLFYRPLLGAVAKLRADEARLSPASAQQQLAALGYADPKAALRHLEALTSGVSRSANIQRTLLPAMLGWFADAPNPDAGLFGFRQISEALGSSHWYLQTLRDEGQVAQRLATLLASSRYATDLLQRAPEGVRMLGERRGAATADPRRAPEGDDLRGPPAPRPGRGGHRGARDPPPRAVPDRGRRPARPARRRRGRLRPHRRDRGDAGGRPGRGLPGDRGRAARTAADPGGDRRDGPARRVRAELRQRRRRAVRARPGARCHRRGRRPGRPRRRQRVPPAARAAGHRPGAPGRRGPAARGQAGTAGAHPGVLRPLLRELVGGLGGAGPAPGQRDRRRRRPVPPVHRADRPAAVPRGRHQRRRRARGAADQGPRRRRAAAARGRPGHPPQARPRRSRRRRVDHPAAADAARRPRSRRCGTTRTLEALQAAVEADLLSESDARALSEAWRTASGLRNAITQVRGKPADSLPRDTRERAAVAHIRGYPPGESDRMVDDYLRVTRRARQVVERVFWG